MDLATILGLIFGLVFTIYGIMTGPDGATSIFNFYDRPSIFITIGGAFSSVLTSFTLKGTLEGLKGFLIALKGIKVNEGETIKTIIDLSNVARKEGLLALEEAANNLGDEFLKKGILLIVDGTDPELVRGIMETELDSIEARHGNVVRFWETVAAMGPAWGMIGTLIGLINMLKNLSDMSTIGPNMSIALLTTFYGSALANWIAIPIAAKLRDSNSTEIMIKEVVIEGILSIQAGENPRVIEEKLKSFLSPKQRRLMSEATDGGEQVG